MPDFYEMQYGLNPLVNDANDDPDLDGLTNLQEYGAGTSPFIANPQRFVQAESALFVVSTRIVVPDADGDGLPDAWELAHGLQTNRNDTGEDPDGDGLTNLQEYNAGTDPQLSEAASSSTAISAFFAVNTSIRSGALVTDTDGDGLPDWWEQKYGLNLGMNDSGADFDGDGLSNIAEFLKGGNPALNEGITEVAVVSAAFALDTIFAPPDTDADGIRDVWEIAHGLDPLRNDAGEDPDHNGRSNLEEYNAGTNPLVDDWAGPSVAASALFLTDTGGFNQSYTRDSDGDGMADWWEQRHGLNWQVNDATADNDGDGLANLAEFYTGGDPLSPSGENPVKGFSNVFLVDTGGRLFDTDGDGLSDWWEKLYFNDPRLAQAADDLDGDGQSNLQEFKTGSNPFDPDSVFRILGMQSTRQTNGTSVVIRWVSFSGNTYSLWRATNAIGPYFVVASNLAATPPFNEASNTTASASAYYRIRLEP